VPRSTLLAVQASVPGSDSGLIVVIAFFAFALLLLLIVALFAERSQKIVVRTGSTELDIPKSLRL
jgi:hypothetical protein